MQLNYNILNPTDNLCRFLTSHLEIDDCIERIVNIPTNLKWPPEAFVPDELSVDS